MEAKEELAVLKRHRNRNYLISYRNKIEIASGD